MSSGNKKPAGGRPLPRRLFSIESLKPSKQRSSSESDSGPASGGGSHWRKQSTASSNLLTLSEKFEDGPDPFADNAGTAWTEKGMVQSPKDEVDDEFGEDAVTPRPPKTPPTARPEPRRGRANAPQPLNLGGTLIAEVTSPNAPLSPSRRRWDTVRSHVIPSAASSIRSATPPPLPSSQSDAPSTAIPGPARPSTPRGYRFGKKQSMRHIVEQVRDVTHDETRRLAEEIRKACMLVRFGDVPSRGAHKAEPIIHNTIGSTLHLPFLASASSTLASGGSGTRQTTGGMRRPQSVASLAVTSRAALTVTHIARALTSSTSVNRPKALPCETQVLAALLVPFVGPYSNDQVAVEQQTAVETFEYAIRTWKAATNEAELDRCIWCCRAASVFSRSRMRIIGTLSSLLFSREKTFEVETPAILQTLLQSLFALLAVLRSSPDSTTEADTVAGYIAAIKDGQSGTPTQQALEKEYGVRHSKGDSDERIREIIVAESVIGCLEVGSEASRRWTLHRLVEEYWSSSDSSMLLSPLLTTMTWRKLNTFVNSTVSLLLNWTGDPRKAVVDADTIIHLLRTRILPEVEAMRDDAFAVVGEIQSSIIRLVLELLCVRGSSEREWVMLYFCHWVQEGGKWRQSVENSLQEFITHGEWAVMLRLMPILEELPEEIRKSLMPQLLPAISDRLTTDPPELPCAPLADFLESAAISCPKAFFKPVFTCAASMKDLTIANQICALHAVARFYPALWTHDPGMMAVALMTDPATSRGNTLLPQSAVPEPAKGKARYGQMMIMIELIQHLRKVRQLKDPAVLAATVKFVVSLEARLGMLIEAKEQQTLIPASQRLLFCALFRECRLLTRSLKPAAWLPSVVSWTSSYLFDADTDPDEGLNEDEVSTTLWKLESLYEQAKTGMGGAGIRKTIAPGSASIDPQSSKGGASAATQEPFFEPVVLLKSLVDKKISTALELLVTVSGLLQPNDFMQLAPIMWYQHLDNTASHVVAPACFLIMQSAEKLPEEFSALIHKDLSDSDASMRRKAIQRIATMLSWRLQLLSQEVILDRTYRRPFKLTRPPILFVPTDIGSSLFELEEDPNDFKDSKGHVLPQELRRRLSEVGWSEERGEMDPKTEWIKTPVARLPTQQLDSLSTSTDADHGPLDPPSPSPSPEPSPTRASPRETPLARRDSSTGHGKAKRRPVFVVTMVALFPRLAAMVKDNDFVVANAARSLVLDLMRDDPPVLSRAVFSKLSGDATELVTAVTAMRDFLHCEYTLPPGIAHHVLNHVAGFLKSAMKQAEVVNPLHGYAYITPIVAKLTPQVSKMSMRDIRRAKVDHILLPSGALWWNDTTPPGPMFPRSLETNYDPFNALPSPVVWATMVRTAQNLLFLHLIRRNPQDVKVFRKSVSTLVLPINFDDRESTPIPLTACIPSHNHFPAQPNASLTALSLTLARSHLLLLHQVFRSISRHLNDREELALLLDGINRILLAHGDDVGIVSHSMLNYLVASTRFRRLFTSGGGYTMFMPAVMKVYCEAKSHPSIRAIIEFSVNRFYALHQESFIFQSCDVLSNVVALPGVDGAAFCENIFTLLSTLKNTAPLSHPEVGGLSALSKIEEQEAIMITIAEKVPQAFLASVHRNTQDKNQVTVDVPDEFDSKRLGLDDLVRLFLTVIAHNPTILRAQQFLRFLMFLAPHLYHASASTRSVLRDGISALGSILLNKGITKGKAPEGASQVDELGPNAVSQTGLSQANLSQSSVPSDLLSMRLDFLQLVVNFTKEGGTLSPLASQRVLELVKLVFKDSRSSVPRVAAFLADYVRAVLLRNNHPELKEVVTLLTDVAPIISSYSITVDFSGVFDVVATLASNTVFANQPAFARVLVTQYCSGGLEACEVAASENLLWVFPMRGSLLNLLDRALLVVGADVISELEKREPTYEFLSGVILPFVLRMKTSVDIANDSQWAEKWRRDVYAKAWMRLLVYVLAVIQRADFIRSESKTILPSIERRKSTDSRRSTLSIANPKPAMALVVALQILKVITTRAEQDLSTALPGVWGQIGGVLREALSDGDAGFAVPSRPGYSEPPSPTHSPKSSTFNIGGDRDDNPFLTPSLTPAGPRSRAQRRPRILDYMTWSLIEWLCLRRSPLALQMRVFVQEKIAILHQELSANGGAMSAGPVSPLNMSASFTASPIRSRARPVSNIFSKPRRSFLGAEPGSAVSTPRSSALFNSASLPTFDEFGLQSSTPRKYDDRQPGYQLMPSPLTPTRRAARESGPKIVHLGPVRPISPSGEPGRRSFSPGSQRSGLGMARTALALAKEMVVESPVLVRTTVRRIRVAQAMLGYPFLPLANVSSMDSMGELGEFPEPEGLARAWSRAEAVEALVQETKDLIDEWREDEDLDVGDDSGILVDLEEPRSGQP